MFHRVLFNFFKYTTHLIRSRYKILKFEINDAEIYVHYISLLTGRTVRKNLNDLFGDLTLLNRFSKDDCIRLGFLGFGKMFMLKEHKSMTDLKMAFEKFIDDFNASRKN